MCVMRCVAPATEFLRGAPRVSPKHRYHHTGLPTAASLWSSLPSTLQRQRCFSVRPNNFTDLQSHLQTNASSLRLLPSLFVTSSSAHYASTVIANHQEVVTQVTALQYGLRLVPVTAASYPTVSEVQSALDHARRLGADDDERGVIWAVGTEHAMELAKNCATRNLATANSKQRRRQIIFLPSTLDAVFSAASMSSAAATGLAVTEGLLVPLHVAQRSVSGKPAPKAQPADANDESNVEAQVVDDVLIIDSKVLKDTTANSPAALVESLLSSLGVALSEAFMHSIAINQGLVKQHDEGCSLRQMVLDSIVSAVTVAPLDDSVSDTNSDRLQHTVDAAAYAGRLLGQSPLLQPPFILACSLLTEYGGQARISNISASLLPALCQSLASVSMQNKDVFGSSIFGDIVSHVEIQKMVGLSVEDNLDVNQGLDIMAQWCDTQLKAHSIPTLASIISSSSSSSTMTTTPQTPNSQEILEQVESYLIMMQQFGNEEEKETVTLPHLRPLLRDVLKLGLNR